VILLCIPAGEPIFEGRAGADVPGADFFRRQGLDGFQFVAEHNLALNLDMIGKDDLVAQFKGVMPDKTNDFSIEAKFFSYFAQDAVFGRFAFFEESCYDAEPLLRPAFVARQDDFALVLDDGGDDGDGVIPEDEIAGWAGLAGVTRDFGIDEFGGAFGAEFVGHEIPIVEQIGNLLYMSYLQ